MSNTVIEGAMPKVCVDVNTEARVLGASIRDYDWVDISSNLQRFGIRRGRSNELQRFGAGTATLSFDNRDRALDPTFTGTRTLGDNTKPQRFIRIGATDPSEANASGETQQYLDLSNSLSYISSANRNTQGLGGASVTKMQITIKVAFLDLLNFETQTLYARWDNTNNIFNFDVSTTGFLRFRWIDSSSISHTAISTTTADGVFPEVTGKAQNAVVLRVLHEFTGGVSSSTKFFYSTDDGASFTQLGATIISATSQGIDDTANVNYSIGALDGGGSYFVGNFYNCLFEIDVGAGFLTVNNAIADECGFIRKSTATFDDNFDIVLLWTIVNGVPMNAPYNLFLGLIDSFVLKLPRGNIESTVEIQATDIFKALAKRKLTTSYPQELSSVRVGKVLSDAVVAPLSDISVGDHTVQASTLVNVPALEHLYRVDFSEFGRLFVNRHGKVVFQSRTDLLDASNLVPIQIIDGTDYHSISDLRFEDNLIWNAATVSIAGGTDQTATESTSIAEYGRNDLLRTGLILLTDGDALTLASFLASRYKEPGTRISSLSFDPRLDPSLWERVLSSDIGQVYTIEVQPAKTGNVYSQNVFIDGVNTTYDKLKKPGEFWDTTWQLSPVLAEYAQLDDQGPDQLDVDAILGP